ncbi:MAG: prolyl oligopeptidase family serine peptidase [Bacteroidetes bacterium]|nr:prolyl oligopeptidase family serine peptidase [Bacteroidota bacterium]
MKKIFHSIVLLLLFLTMLPEISGQSALTIEKIMKGDRFTGFSPENISWSPSGKLIYFYWNPEMDTIRSLYSISRDNLKPQKVSHEELMNLPSSNGVYNRERSKMVYAKEGDFFLLQINSGTLLQITNTSDYEFNPVFSHKEDIILFTRGSNLYSWNPGNGSTEQLTDFRPGKEKPEGKVFDNDRDKWIYEDQFRLFDVLKERKQVNDRTLKEEESLKQKRPLKIFTGTEQVRGPRLSPDENYVTSLFSANIESQRTLIPEFVTESGYTETNSSRSKVGAPSFSSSVLMIYDRHRDTVYKANTDDIPGIGEKTDFAYSQPSGDQKKQEKRGVIMNGPEWSDDGKFAVVDIFSTDNKDRWIMVLDIKTGGLKLLDRQHDDAWIGGPGIRYGSAPSWLNDNRRIFFQSEESGYSHLYTIDVISGQKKAITSGKYEVYNTVLSRDKKYWYYLSNESDPGIRELYRIAVQDGSKVKLTNLSGGVEAELSPDEKYFALRVSSANKPWELYLMENREKAIPVKVTESMTSGFSSYPWRVPEYVTIKASDGTMVPARLYKPSNSSKPGPAIIFVHGAGYLQNAHRWWSSYSREYMFHNYLVDNGYTVLDIDYRGSSGYGRDWRTAIYRFMGGRDLEDHIDGTRYLVEQHNVDAGKIGIYGGSYGGFITLMAMFTKPGTFKAGAALRPVTDWAHYNHGYTSNILNTPISDSLSYIKSSPIYYADGLQGALLICHGMVDDNVHFQDVVRLSQRLIELGKDNWELAVYPVESHGFVEPSSWTDEYKRIFRLFESNLK